MVEFKPLLDIGGKPALNRLIDTIRDAGISDVVVVTGFEKSQIEAAALYCRTVYNADYESGMFSSVQAGVRSVKEADAALLFPADVPLVSAETILGLIAAYEQGDPARFAVPVHEGKNGHPLLIPRVYYDEILAYTGEGGLKGVRSRYDGEMLRYKVSDIGCVLDMDTPEDYERILEHIKR